MTSGGRGGPTTGVGWDVVTWRGAVFAVMFGRQVWVILSAVQDADLASGGKGGSCQKCGLG